MKKPEYFGQYGNILKIVVNTVNAYKSNETKVLSHSAYITYSKSSEASLAILAVDGIMIGGGCIRATYGSTRFCAFYLKGKDCTNKECLYLHTEASDYDDILDKEDVNKKINFKQQQLQAIKIADVFNFEIRKKIITSKVVIKDAILPDIKSIYENPVVYDNDLNYYEFEEYMKQDKGTCTNAQNTSQNTNQNSNQNTKTDLRSSKEGLKYTNDLRNSKDSIKDGSKDGTGTKDIIRGNSKDLKDIVKYHKEDFNNISDAEMFVSKPRSNSDINHKNSISTTSDSTNDKDITIKLFKSKDNSRFSFIEEDKDHIDIGIEVPKFITQIIINKMLKPQDRLTKLLEQSVIKSISDDSTEIEGPDHEWANFLLENASVKYDL